MVKKRGSTTKRKKRIGHRGRTLTPAEIEELCINVEKYRIAGATYEKCAEILGYSSDCIERHYKEYSKRKLEYIKNHYEDEIREVLERQKDIIRRARQKGKLKTEEMANRNYLIMLQSCGFAPKAPEKIEHSGSIWELKKLQDQTDKKKGG